MNRETALNLIKEKTYNNELIFLSKNFTLQELVRTDDRTLVFDNFLIALSDIKIFDKLCVLSNRLLQPLRDKIGCPIQIHSGFRCKKLNDKIGSSDKSQHILGEAVDFHLIKPISVYDQFKLVYKTLLDNKIDYGQIIYEYTWIHLSLPNKFKNLINSQPLQYIEGKYLPINLK